MKTKDSHAKADPSRTPGSRCAAVAANAYPPLKSCLSARLVPLAALRVALTATVQAQFQYATSGGRITITGYTGLGGGVVIPDTIEGKPVASIGAEAFFGCTSLTSITIPDSVTSIGQSAFSGCAGLTSVTIGNGVTSIGQSAFSGCRGLTSVTIPDSVWSIGDSAFLDCTSLTAFDVDALNRYYSSLEGVLFSKSQDVLIQCPAGKAGSYTSPDSVAYIGWAAFLGCASLTSVTIPDGVTSIGGYAFEGCTGLTSVMIPASVINIGHGDFLGAGFHLPFSGCTGLTAIEVDQENSTYCSLEGVLFSRSQNRLIACPGGITGHYGVPRTVTTIGSRSFLSCPALTSVTIPDSVITIEWAAFGGCTGLRGVYFEGSAPALQDSFFMGRRMPVLPDSVSAVVYHRAGTTGFGLTFADRPTALWPFLEGVPCAEDLTEEDRTELGESQHAVFIRTAPEKSYEVQSAGFVTGPWRADGLVTATSTQKRLVFDKPEVQAFYRVTLAE